MTYLIMLGIIGATIIIYFVNNPLGHSGKYRMRCFWNWFPLGLTYAFLYMGRYNLTVSKSALGDLMSNEDFGTIFGVGALVYGFAFLVNGPLTDRIGGKNAILISSSGAAVMNVLMGIITYMILNGQMARDNLILFFTILYALNMYFQSFGAVSVVKVNSFWFHVKERGVLGGIFGTLISLGLYFAFDWGDAIVRATRLQPEGQLGVVDKLLSSFLISPTSKIAPTWFVFFIPAGILAFFFVLDLFTIKDTPGQAGFDDFDTGDASSGEMEHDFTTLELFKKLLTNPTVLIIAFIEFCSGVIRNGIMHWYHIFIHEMKLSDKAFLFKDADFFVDNWGLLLCFAGIIGGFSAGFISDKLFQSRRGPSAVFMYGLMFIAMILMILFLNTNQIGLGITVVFISLCVIGVHGVLSGTATADFGGRKAAATAVGVVDGFVYLGTSLQGFALGSLTPHMVDDKIVGNWSSWPLFLLPFTVIGFILALKIWQAFPGSKKTA